MNRPTCPYCHKPARFVTGEVVYPNNSDLWNKRFWYCAPCGAYVGCHAGSEEPLGRLANADLRRAKRQAHAAFDPIWQDGEMDRGEAYAWLSDQLGIDPDECHIGMFDIPTCQRVRSICDAYQQQDIPGIIIDDG